MNIAALTYNVSSLYGRTPPVCSAKNGGAGTGAVSHFTSVTEAVSSLLAESAPQVIAFGEFHPQPGYDYRTAKAYFADEVIPLLAEEGITDLVVEQLLDEPIIATELAYFAETGRIGTYSTPTLWRTIKRYVDQADLLRIITTARRYGIRVHPGGMTEAQAAETIWRADWYSDRTVQLTGWQYAEEAGRRTADRLMQAGVRFAVYNGFRHHAAHAGQIAAEEGGSNYGAYLARTLGESYVEVELFPAGGLRTLGQNSLDFLGLGDWAELAPAGGVNLIERQTGSILIPAAALNN
ncbi:MAG: hypothetical protein WC529_06545 [Candidatus Margulisiibacteriota bacterium]